MDTNDDLLAELFVHIERQSYQDHIHIDNRRQSTYIGHVYYMDLDHMFVADWLE
jgi:hypothetical protein